MSRTQLLGLVQQSGLALARHATVESSQLLGAQGGSVLQQLRGFALGRVPKQISLVQNYKQLSKFKLSALVVLTAGAGYAAGSGDSIDWKGFAWTSLGTFGASACANTLNQLYEVTNDRLMSRTCNRPLPAGRLSSMHAAGFALATGAMGLAILYYKANPTTAALGAANIALYAGVYTPLKQLSIANTWVGAIVGAIPPLMGWAAASGQLEAGAAVLAAALFSWQMPHFMALAWMCKDDYLRGGFRMMSAVDLTGRRTGMVALRHSLFLLPLGYAAHQLGLTSEPFVWEAAALAGMLAIPSLRFISGPGQKSARTLFKASLLYLPLLMLGMAVHRQPNEHTVSVDMAVVREWIEEQVAGEPANGVVPGLRLSMERSILAVTRLFGFGIQELRCPSTVLAEEGEGSSRSSGGKAAGARQASKESAEVVLGEGIVEEQQQQVVQRQGSSSRWWLWGSKQQ